MIGVSDLWIFIIALEMTGTSPRCEKGTVLLILVLNDRVQPLNSFESRVIAAFSELRAK